MNARWLRPLVHRPVAVLAAGYLVLVVVATVFAGVLAPYDPQAQDLSQPLSGPSAEHWLGTGELGRDVLSRLLYGGRTTLSGAAIAVVVFAVCGASLGLVAGYRGGWADRIVVLWADTVYSVPVVVVLLVVLAIFPGNELAAMVALGLLGSPGLARVVRASTQGIREQLYIRAARSSGLREGTIMRRHVLPQLVGPIVVQVSLFAAAAVGLETAIGFLRLGGAETSWGALVAEASYYVGVVPWLLVPSGLAIVLLIVSLGLLGDAFRDSAAERRGMATVPTRTAATPAVPAATTPALLGPVSGPVPLLSVRGLSVSFPGAGGPVPIVTDVWLEVDRGEALGLVGESGCGKTVTMSAVLGLLRGGGQVTAGSVRLDGVELLGADRRTLAAVRGGRIGWISQDAAGSLDPSFTVGSQLAEVLRAHVARGRSRAQVRTRVAELLALVQLPEEVAAAYPHQLSGGMAQRVAVAAAVAGEPALIVADEPTTALDVTVQAEILELLRDVQGRGAATVLVTHDWGVLADLCGRASVMYAGEIVESGRVSDLLTAPRHPYTAALLRSSPHLVDPGEAFTTIPGNVPPPGTWPRGCRFAPRCSYARADCLAGSVDLAGDASGTVRCLHPLVLAAGTTR